MLFLLLLSLITFIHNILSHSYELEATNSAYYQHCQMGINLFICSYTFYCLAIAVVPHCSVALQLYWNCSYPHDCYYVASVQPWRNVYGCHYRNLSPIGTDTKILRYCIRTYLHTNKKAFKIIRLHKCRTLSNQA